MSCFWVLAFDPLADAVLSRDHITIYTLDGTPLIFQHFDGPLVPTLKVLHQCKPSSYIRTVSDF